MRVGELCLKHDVLIVSDEIHFDLILPGYEHTVFASLSPELSDRMIVCTSVSKTFNLAGMQCSNIVIPKRRAARSLQGHDEQLYQRSSEHHGR